MDFLQPYILTKLKTYPIPPNPLLCMGQVQAALFLCSVFSLQPISCYQDIISGHNLVTQDCNYTILMKLWPASNKMFKC